MANTNCKHPLVEWVPVTGGYYKMHCEACRTPLAQECWYPDVTGPFRLAPVSGVPPLPLQHSRQPSPA